MKFEKLSFTGVFTQLHRKRIKMYRMVYGLTYHDLGMGLGCDWSTVMKWERGTSRECSLLLLVPLQAFFNGELDSLFERVSEQCYTAMVECMMQIIRERRNLLLGKVMLGNGTKKAHEPKRKRKKAKDNKKVKSNVGRGFTEAF